MTNDLPPFPANVRELIPAPDIQRRVAELGEAITRAYRLKDLVVVGVLKGCFQFMADLCRSIPLPLTCDFIGLSSYGDRTRSSGVVRITSDLTQPVAGKDLLVVEDIVDTGLTIQYLLDNLRTRKPASIRVCTLLEKPSRRQVQVPIDYRGFEVPDLFVVGYGLDYMGQYRNLSFIGTLESIA